MLVHKKCHKITGPCGKDYSDITTDSGEVNNSSIYINLLNSVVYMFFFCDKKETSLLSHACMCVL